VAAKCKKSNSQKSKFQKLKIAKAKILKTFVTKCFREIDREIVFPQDRVLLLKITAKSLLRVLAPFAMCVLYI
jgi:hypothetical protein